MICSDEQKHSMVNNKKMKHIGLKFAMIFLKSNRESLKGDNMKAIAYLAERKSGQKEHDISIEEQKKRLQEYADLMGIEIVQWFEDSKVSSGHIMERPGLSNAFHTDKDFDVFLVEGIRSLGNIYSDFRPLVNLLVKAGKPIIEANYHWDVVSQKVRKECKEQELEAYRKIESRRNLPKVESSIL